MASNKLKDRFDDLERIAKAAGLQHYPVQFFEVPVEIIYEVSSYGLPTRYSHWSFGRVYEHQKTYGEMGFSKIYELILNNNPSFAFLDKNNSEVINLLVAAHCFSHSDFFANNIMFKRCGETDMVHDAKVHAEIIDGFRRDYGDDEVDNWLDVALSLERHVDVYKGLHRKAYPKRHVKFIERKRKQWDDITGDDKKPRMEKRVEGIHIPPHPEKDLLWFLSEYANMEPWQQKIFEIVRRESYYFYPQFRTKIMNEGWASYWHAELMGQYHLGDSNDYGAKVNYPLTDAEFLDFAASHEKVVQPGLKIQLKQEMDDIDPRTGKKVGTIKRWSQHVVDNPNLFHYATRINPYYVGFRIFRDIKDRWDKYYEEGYREGEWGEKIPVTINGDQKIREVMEEEDDISFLRNYLTEELCDDLHLFSYGNIDNYKDDYETQERIRERTQEMKRDSDLGQNDIDSTIVDNKTIAVRSKRVDDVIAAFSKQRYNYGVPMIVVRRIDESGLLRLEHLQEDPTNTDLGYAENVLRYVHQIWGREVEIIRKHPEEGKTRILRWNGFDFELDYQSIDYPDIIEKEAPPSSW